MRRLVLIATCIAVLGAGAAVWIAGASATTPHRPALRVPPTLLKQLATLAPAATLRRAATVRRAPTLRAVPVPSTCYVAGGGCSLHPCVEFATSSSAVYQLVTPTVVTALRAPSTRSQCRRNGGQLQRVGTAIVTAQAAPVPVHQTAGAQLIK